MQTFYSKWSTHQIIRWNQVKRVKIIIERRRKNKSTTTTTAQFEAVEPSILLFTDTDNNHRFGRSSDNIEHCSLFRSNKEHLIYVKRNSVDVCNLVKFCLGFGIATFFTTPIPFASSNAIFFFVYKNQHERELYTHTHVILSWIEIFL